MVRVLIPLLFLSLNARAAPAIPCDLDRFSPDSDLCQSGMTRGQERAWRDRGGAEPWGEVGLTSAYGLGGLRGNSIGLGGVLRFGVLFLHSPDISEGDAAWTGFRLGTGVEFPQMAGVRVKGTRATGEFVKALNPVVHVPVYIGGQWSIGKFVTSERWEGWTVAFDVVPIKASFQTGLNDFSSMATRLQLASTHFVPTSLLCSPEPQWSLSVEGALSFVRGTASIVVSFGWAFF